MSWDMSLMRKMPLPREESLHTRPALVSPASIYGCTASVNSATVSLP